MRRSVDALMPKDGAGSSAVPETAVPATPAFNNQPRLLVADRQTAGRGRLGRAWHSWPGASLTFSLAWPWQGAPLTGLSYLPSAALLAFFTLPVEMRAKVAGLIGGQAEELVFKTEGRLCVRFYRRPDCSMLASDCPIGLRAARVKG